MTGCHVCFQCLPWFALRNQTHACSSTSLLVFLQTGLCQNWLVRGPFITEHSLRCDILRPVAVVPLCFLPGQYVSATRPAGGCSPDPLTCTKRATEPRTRELQRPESCAPPGAVVCTAARAGKMSASAVLRQL